MFVGQSVNNLWTCNLNGCSQMYNVNNRCGLVWVYNKVKWKKNNFTKTCLNCLSYFNGSLQFLLNLLIVYTIFLLKKIKMSKFTKTSKTRYDYNLMIMKSPKPATDTIYSHIKFWWYRTMLNFYPPCLCRVLAAILKMADILKMLKTQNCSSNGDLSLGQNVCLYHYPVRSYQH